MRYTRANALKQLAFFDAEHLKCFSPKMLNVGHKKLFTRPSRFISKKRLNDCSKEFLFGQQPVE
jgi:hypothetical protein